MIIRIPETTLDGTAFDTYGDMIIAPGNRISEEVAFGFIDDFEKSMTEVEPFSEITMKFDIYETDYAGNDVLLDSPKPVTVTYDASNVEKVSAYSDHSDGYEEEQLSEEELAALKGWWTREGDFYNDETHTSATITFITWDENKWYLNGHFEGETYWGGNADLTDEGLSGTMQTVSFSAAGETVEGDPIDVKISEDGENGILLTLGTGEEYHLVPVAY